MDTYQAITTRRTIRLYDQRPIPSELMERILNAGRIAPSAANRQVLEFVVIREPENCEQIFKYLAWAGYVKPRRNPPEGKRPTAYIIVVIRDKEYTPTNAADAGAAMENMILTAWNEGVGCCWIGSVTDREAVRRIFEIPQDYHIFGVLAMGFAGEQPIMETADDSIKYWLDDNDRLHVPKRPLEKIVHHEKFERRSFSE